MERIKSFEVDHTKFGIGMYTSRIDGDINRMAAGILNIPQFIQ